MFKLPIGVDINNLIDDLRFFSWEASDILLHYSKRLKNQECSKEIIKTKNRLEPVTIADLEVNDLIIKRINKNYKEVAWNILSEENVKTGDDIFVANSQWIWILDPLDGTKDFIQGTENYAMHLALNYDKKPCIGLVLIPEKGELWMGSIGCKIASIIRGECDIYISLSLPGKSSPKDWDFAAPEAILRAAGGSITNVDNEELSYGKASYKQDGIIIASSNKQTHKEICLQIKEIIMKNDLYNFDS